MLISKRALKVRMLLSAFNTSVKIGKVLPPKTVIWEATRSCDFNCMHCGAYDDRNSNIKEMETGRVKDIINQLGKYGVKNFFVTGGEPFLRKDLLELMEYAKSCKLNTGISSNGFHIKDEHFEQIERLVNTIQISIDGLENTHDTLRRKSGSFKAAVKSLRKINQNGKTKTCMTSTISGFNFHEIERLYELSKEISQMWRVIVIMPIGKAKENNKLFLSRENTLQLLDFIENNSTKTHPISIGENIGYLGKMESIRKDELFFCGAGILSCCIGANGVVRGCPELPIEERFTEGDLNNESFSDIWESGFSDYRNDKFAPEECLSCKHFGVCRGGCKVMQIGKMHCAINRLGL